MKALSFHQPRAEQIMRGLKTVDVRTWQVQHRGTLAVHASAQRRDDRCHALGFDPQALSYGALVGTVELTGITPLDEAAYEALRDRHLLDAPFPGSPCYAWHLANPARFAQPSPCRGHVRLFDAHVGQDAILPSDVNVRQDAILPSGVDVGQDAILSHRHTPYHTAPPPQPDPDRPFVLYTIPEAESGYRVALYQWLPHHNRTAGRSNDFSRSRATEVATTSTNRSDDFSRSPGAMWSIELGGDRLRAVADHLLNALRANGYKATGLARAAGDNTPFYLDELTGLRLALILLAVKPLTRHERIEAVGQGVQAMGDEEAYYWFSKCSAGPDALRAQKALRILLAGE
jgi:hypothetical protein